MILPSQWYPKYGKLNKEHSIQIINQFPILSLPSHHTAIEIWVRKRQNCGANFVLLPSPPPNSWPSQKTLASGGEEISFGDLTVPPTLTKIRKSKQKPKKLPLSNPATNWRKIWIRIWLKNYNFKDDRMELKIIPFKYERKINNERFIYL